MAGIRGMTMRVRRLGLGLLAFAFSSAALANEGLWKRLGTEPNLIMVMRHMHAAGGPPLAWDESGNCAGERRLTEKGKAQARQIRAGFESRGIKPVVISSPMCRCLDTAKHAFDGQVITDPELREIASADAQRTRAFESKARALISSKRGVAPLVFISHTPNVDQLTMELIDEEDLLVGKTSETGEIEVLGKIRLQP